MNTVTKIFTAMFTLLVIFTCPTSAKTITIKNETGRPLNIIGIKILPNGQETIVYSVKNFQEGELPFLSEQPENDNYGFPSTTRPVQWGNLNDVQKLDFELSSEGLSQVLVSHNEKLTTFKPHDHNNSHYTITVKKIYLLPDPSGGEYDISVLSTKTVYH